MQASVRRGANHIVEVQTFCDIPSTGELIIYQ